jgi:isoquinoline 1-oxidoreductase beta subunit
MSDDYAHASMTIAKASRRDVLKFGFASLFALKLTARSASAKDKSDAFSVFLSFNRDGTVTLASPYMEGGQGIFTGLAQIVAEELDFPPNRFRVHCPPSQASLNLIGGLRFTGGSLSVRSSFKALREMGATARAMLIRAAADRMGAPVAELTTSNGSVLHQRKSKSISYFDLASLASQLPVPDQTQLRQPNKFRYIGQSVRRLDAAEKSTGKAVYAIDIDLPGMVFAAVKHHPLQTNGSGEILNKDNILKLRGVKSIESLPGAIAIVAERWWYAHRALSQLEIRWADAGNIQEGTQGKLNNGTATALQIDQYQALLLAAAKNAEQASVTEKNGDEARVEVLYTFPYLAHAQLEPPSATARFNPDGTLEIWTPNQSPDMFRDAAARLVNLDPSKVTVHTSYVGGFFGRFGYYGAPSPVHDAALLSKRLGRPVKVIWSRESEFANDSYRPASVVKYSASLAGSGAIPKDISAIIYGEGATGHIFGSSGKRPDDSATEGLLPSFYSFEDSKADHKLHLSPRKIGYWRAVGFSSNVFATESFIDELAERRSLNPFDFRMSLLKNQVRPAYVLKAVRDLAGGIFDKPYKRADGVICARGLALTSCFGSYVANVAEISIRSGQIAVENVWACADVGIVINPSLVIDQIRSGIIMGISAALNEEIVFQSGMPVQTNFDSYTLLRPDNVPKIIVELVQSTEDPGGVGEIGLPAVAPAIASALHVLTKQRIRDLPLQKAGPFNVPG